jgi:hypothetical protein
LLAERAAPPACESGVSQAGEQNTIEHKSPYFYTYPVFRTITPVVSILKGIFIEAGSIKKSVSFKYFSSDKKQKLIKS